MWYIMCHQMKRILFTWLLELASDQLIFHQSAQHHLVVRSKAYENVTGGFRLSKELLIPCTFCHVQVQLYSILEKQWFVRPVRCFDFERQRGSDAEEKCLILITVLLSTVLSTGVIHIHWIPSETLTEILTSPHYMTLQPRRSQSLWIVKSSSWLRS